METKSITIQVPEGMCIDREKSTFEKIVFKPINTKPRSWEEFCEKYPVKKGETFIDTIGKEGIITISQNYSDRDHLSDRNILPTEEYAKAFLALMQLISLRQAWIGEWKPDWIAGNGKFVIRCIENRLTVDIQFCSSYPLSFPTHQMAEEFLSCFQDLLEEAKILL